MASSGATAWNKYFRGRNNLPTKMKKESPLYDVDGKKIPGTVAAGTEIVYVGEKTYNSKALVQIKKNNKYITCRVTFDNIVKPGSKASAAVSLKPQAFGVKDNVKYNSENYYKLIKSNISERNDLDAATKLYLDALLDHTCKKITDSKLSEIYKKVSSELPLNDIKKDFGEVIGPLAIRYRQILQPKGIKTTNAMKIEVPLRPNEPLMDYSVSEGTSTYIISAKSGSTTNVVKPKDILDLINKNKTKRGKWEGTKEYNILEVLDRYPTLIGPIKAVGYLNPKLINEKMVGDNEKTFSIAQVAKFINSNNYLSSKKSPTINEIMYECEKEIQTASKSKTLDINGIFSDAIKNTVIYVKFDITKNGVGEWDVIVSDDIKKVGENKRAYLRTKNGYTRAADKMGVQI